MSRTTLHAKPASAGFSRPSLVGQGAAQLRGDTAATVLSRRAVYRTPSGRLCRWVGAGAEGDRRSFHVFAYIVRPLPGQAQVMEDQFVLAAANLHLMKVVG